jgi:hypothetical protein
MRPITRLTEQQRLLYCLIMERPRDAQQLFDLAYWLHPQDQHVSVIKAHISQMNRKLCYIGEQIKADRGEPYRIVKVKPHAHSKLKPARNPSSANVERAKSAIAARIARRRRGMVG